MSNIVLVGFSDGDSSRLSKEIVSALVREGREKGCVITTISQAWVHSCENNADAPYVIVRDTDVHELEAVGSIIFAAVNKEQGGVDVELDKIHGFYDKTETPRR